jgi:hypothetical protein
MLAADERASAKESSPDRSIAFRRFDEPVGHGALRVARVGPYVLVDCLLDHVIVIRRVDRAGVPVTHGEARIVHDGPIWGFDAVEVPKPAGANATLLLAAGGVEDHPLDRTEGSFGFIDSFDYLYRVEGNSATRLATVNTSAFGLVTPKALHLVRGALGSVEVDAFAYGSDKAARVEWAREPDGNTEPQIATYACPPGSATTEPLGDGSFAIANPLLDAWVHGTFAAGGKSTLCTADDSKSTGRSSDSRVGEALFFTSMMAPWNKSDGRLSRFTCEARLATSKATSMDARTTRVAETFARRPSLSSACSTIGHTSRAPSIPISPPSQTTSSVLRERRATTIPGLV